MKAFDDKCDKIKEIKEIKEIKGRIHSIETFGTVDGPGVRYVVFFQGCPLRCKFCHNPDTWNTDGGNEMTAEEVLDGYFRNKEFYRGGGLTATGGEPLLQLNFLTELFKKAREKGIHTCLDTSGAVYTEGKRALYEELLRFTDLVLLDIKHTDETAHRELTGVSGKNTLKFLDLLEENNTDFIIRHVIVPGITYNKKNLFYLGRLIGRYRNLKGVEVLPYHDLGVKKYEKLGIDYPLEGVKPLSKEEARAARSVILKGIEEIRRAL